MPVSALEIRLIAYGLLAFGIIGGTAYTTWHLTSDHYKAVMTADRAAEQQALLVQQQKVIAAQQAQAEVAAAAEKQYEDLKASSSVLGRELASSLRQYASLHSILVSASSGASAGAHAASPGTAGNSGLTELAGQAATACEEDAAELTALQSWAAQR